MRKPKQPIPESEYTHTVIPTIGGVVPVGSDQAKEIIERVRKDKRRNPFNAGTLR